MLMMVVAATLVKKKGERERELAKDNDGGGGKFFNVHSIIKKMSKMDTQREFWINSLTRFQFISF